MKHLIALCALFLILFGGWILYEGNKVAPEQNIPKTIQTGTSTDRFIQ